MSNQWHKEGYQIPKWDSGRMSLFDFSFPIETLRDSVVCLYALPPRPRTPVTMAHAFPTVALFGY